MINGPQAIYDRGVLAELRAKSVKDIGQEEIKTLARLMMRYGSIASLVSLASDWGFSVDELNQASRKAWIQQDHLLGVSAMSGSGWDANGEDL